MNLLRLLSLLALVDGEWKLVAKGPAGAWELYNMTADRTEMNNLAAQQPERVRTMVRQWETWAHRAQVLPWIWKPQYGQTAATATAGNNRKNKASR
jgi:hypothetical protein